MDKEVLDPDKVLVIHNFLSREECAALIRRSEDLAYEAGTVADVVIEQVRGYPSLRKGNKSSLRFRGGESRKGAACPSCAAKWFENKDSRPPFLSSGVAQLSPFLLPYLSRNSFWPFKTLQF